MTHSPNTQNWYPNGKYLFYAIFRKEELCYRGGRTARKIANTIASSANGIQQAILPAYPMISYHAKCI